MAKPIFISFEGIEGCGKTTLSRWLTDQMNQHGAPAVWTREPGHTWDTPERDQFAQAIRHALLNLEDLDERAELFLFLADRSYHSQRFILPQLQAGISVLCDRYIDSTVVYQGYGRGIDLDSLREWNRFATRDLMPHVTFLIDLPVEVALQRAKEITRFERETLDFHETLRQGFIAEARREPERYRLIDGTLRLEDAQSALWQAVQPYLT
ncbi:MAG: dTMP kinase [Fimbriimonadia bacterium]|nr:dTMP kinase [Fimbriimonadia bacterium]